MCCARKRNDAVECGVLPRRFYALQCTGGCGHVGFNEVSSVMLIPTKCSLDGRGGSLDLARSQLISAHHDTPLPPHFAVEFGPPPSMKFTCEIGGGGHFHGEPKSTGRALVEQLEQLEL